MRSFRIEAWVVVCYAVGYIGYLFFYPEGEIAHWVSMVAIPVVGLRLLRRRRLDESWNRFLRSLGVGGKLRLVGVVAAIAVGCAISCVQFFGKNGTRIRELLVSGEAAWALPASIALMLVTAATTEEFFFRGVLQTRLTAILKVRGSAIVVTALIFSVYHVPYALQTPGWGTQGDLLASVGTALATGFPLGLLLGVVFSAGGQNLAASVLAHALINSLPGMLIIEQLFGP